MKINVAFSLLGSAFVLAKPPNIVFILTDDQDLHMNSLDYMPLLNKHIIDKGTTFAKHYCTVAVCCPSRANLWTGKAAHNTNVTDLVPPYGGYPKFVSEGWNDNYLPLWLQAAGYNTYYTGKLFNGHTASNYNDPPVNGWNGSDFLLDPYTYRYYDSVMTRNNAAPVSYAGNYSTDVIASKFLSFLDEALSPDTARPFFAVTAPVASHSHMIYNSTTNTSYLRAPEYAPRHAHLFTDYSIPRDESFNTQTDGAVGWIKYLKPLNETVLAYNEEYQRSRLRALQAVDEMVESVVEKLEEAGALDDTYIFYTTDNGYHISQHRMMPGKECGYETDIHIPMVVRGPRVPAGAVIEGVTSHTDVATTILEIAGAPKSLDGKAMPLSEDAVKEFASEHAAIEYWGIAAPEGLYGFHSIGNSETGHPVGLYENNTYKGLRLVGEDYSLYYSVWCTGEKEFYDLKRDSGQIRNLAAGSHNTPSAYTLANRPLPEIISRLDALMMVLKSCSELECTQPWHALHLDGVVKDLKDALSRRYDGFYAEQPKVAYSLCERGYIKSPEGPQQ